MQTKKGKQAARGKIVLLFFLHLQHLLLFKHANAREETQYMNAEQQTLSHPNDFHVLGGFRGNLG